MDSLLWTLAKSSFPLSDSSLLITFVESRSGKVRRRPFFTEFTEVCSGVRSPFRSIKNRDKLINNKFNLADRTFPSTFPWPSDMTHRPGRLLSRPFFSSFSLFQPFFRSLKTIDLVQYSKLRGESGAQWALFSYSIYTSSYITKLSFEQKPLRPNTNDFSFFLFDI